eukprot:5321841-Pyramimonas_sp.AAC.1
MRGSRSRRRRRRRRTKRWALMRAEHPAPSSRRAPAGTQRAERDPGGSTSIDRSVDGSTIERLIDVDVAATR